MEIKITIPDPIVYIVIGGDEHMDPDEIVGVYLTEKSAKDKIKELECENECEEKEYERIYKIETSTLFE